MHCKDISPTRKKICPSALRHTISIVERAMATPAPGSVAPGYNETVISTMRAAIETKNGVSEFNRIEIGGERVSHVFLVRASSVAFDTRHRIRRGGNDYQILQIENIDEARVWTRIFAKQLGGSDVPAVS